MTASPTSAPMSKCSRGHLPYNANQDQTGKETFD
jgi:hypothetical protein